MKLLDIIDYQHPASPAQLPTQPFAQRRLAVRAVVLGPAQPDGTAPVYLVHATAAGGYYKLPGGGVDPGEPELDALRRECREETGLTVAAGEPLGRILQFDAETGFLQESRCWLAHTQGDTGARELTADEAARGFELARFDSLTAALSATTAFRPSMPQLASMQRREVAFLRAARAALDGGSGR